MRKSVFICGQCSPHAELPFVTVHEAIAAHTIHGNCELALHLFSLLSCALVKQTCCILCRDLYNDIAIPGGIAMKSFSEAWGQFCQGVDYNDYSRLQSPARQLLTMISK